MTSTAELVAERDAGLREIERDPDRLNHWRNRWAGEKAHVIYRTSSGEIGFDVDAAEHLFHAHFRPEPGPWAKREAVAIVRGSRMQPPPTSDHAWSITVQTGSRIFADQFMTPGSGVGFGLSTEFL